MSKLLDLAAGLWGKLAVVLAIVGGLLTAVLMIRKGGADGERVAEGHRADEVRARVDAVQPPTPGAVDARLDKGGF